MIQAHRDPLVGLILPSRRRHLDGEVSVHLVTRCVWPCRLLLLGAGRVIYDE